MRTVVHDPERDLSPAGRNAIAAVRGRAVGGREFHRRRIERVLTAAGLDADVTSLCAAALGHGRVTLNFHPDRPTRDGRTVAEALRDEGRYRSQFETGISNGGLTAYAGGDRDRWERRLFDGAYHRPTDTSGSAEVRPAYGGLDLAGFTNGPAPAFGSCAVVLGRRAAGRSTFLFGDSSERHEDLGTADAFEPVLAALFERVAVTGQMLGVAGVTISDLVGRLRATTSPTPPFTRVLDDYIETHTHGPVHLAHDAECLLLDPSYRDTPTGAALLHTAERYEPSARWHPGAQLTLASFPTTTPVDDGRELTRWERFLLSGRGLQLAERVIADHADDHANLTAAAIGTATHSYLREPAHWRTWGAPDPSLTVFKDLWRILAVHGTPLIPRDPVPAGT